MKERENEMLDRWASTVMQIMIVLGGMALFSVAVSTCAWLIHSQWFVEPCLISK